MKIVNDLLNNPVTEAIMSMFHLSVKHLITKYSGQVLISANVETSLWHPCVLCNIAD